MKEQFPCPHCGKSIAFRNPIPTVDIIIELQDGIVLVERRNFPQGWALPGGFVDYGESLEDAAIREAREETSLDIQLKLQLHTYSDPNRDPRFHTVSTVYIASGYGEPKAADDAKGVGIFLENEISFPLAFDHARILADYFALKKDGIVTNGKTKNFGRR